MSTELAWAAGFWDGEGNTAIIRNNLRMQTAQIEPTVLERLRDALGAGTVYGPYEPRRENSQPLWRFMLAGYDNVETAIGLMRPYLSQPKLLQADAALSQHVVHSIGRAGHPRTTEIVDAYAAGASAHDVAALYGVHWTTVTKMVKRLRPDAVRPRGGRRVPNKSIKKEDTYQALKDKGYSKSKAAAISNAQAKKSKKKGK